jgi:O-antigen/teichoic acid export membrane protein
LDQSGSSVTRTTAESQECELVAEILPVAPAARLDSAVSNDTTVRMTSFSTKNLGWSVLKNSGAQVIGRVCVGLLRLVVAGIILRSYGKTMFGEYALLFGLMAIADWLVDFGTTDVFVREFSREPQNGQRLLRILTAAKLIQAPAGFVTLAALIIALRYPVHIVEAGLVGGLNLVFFAGVLVYRVNFRATMTMEREVASELFSVVCMVPMVAFVAAHHGGLVALMACHLISRSIFCSGCVLLGRKQYRFSMEGVTWPDVSWGLQASAAIGVIGFLVGGYESIDLILLSKLGNFSELAYYSAAQRLVWPLLMVLASVGGTFYPIYAAYWPHAREDFERTCHRGLDTVLLLAGLGVCTLVAGAGFFMHLLGPDLVGGAPALKMFALLCFVKAVTSTIGPILYVVKAQQKALQFIAVALLAKTAVIAAVAPRFGYMGVISSAVVVELFFATIPSIYLVQHLSSFRLNWAMTLKVALITLAAALAPHLLFSTGGLPSAISAAIIYISLAIVSGTVHLSDIRSLLRSVR